MEMVPKDALQRLTAAEQATRERPTDAMAWVEFSRANDAVVHTEAAHKAARRAFELAPNNPDVIRQLAATLSYAVPGNAESGALFERLLAMIPTDMVALHYLYLHAMFDGEYRRAAEYAETLDRHYPGAVDVASRIGRAYRLLGDREAAATHYRRAAERCEQPQRFPYDANAAMKPVFTALAGEQGDAERLSAELCRDNGVGIPDLGKPGYPDDSRQAIARLQQCAAGRDIYIFGFGPSLEDAVKCRQGFASLEFAAMSMSNLALIESSVLRPIGKDLDFLIVTHPAVLEFNAGPVRDWFARVPRAILSMPLWLRDRAAQIGQPDFLIGRNDRLFWFDAFNDVMPPSPSNPLQIPAINTLICGLGTAILAKPRRIFLFGFDGQIKGDDSQKTGALYFEEDDTTYNTPRRREPEVRRLAKANLWWDTVRFNEVAPVVMRHLALLFDVPLVPVYNVCPSSALGIFPRISIERFFELARQSAAVP